MKHHYALCKKNRSFLRYNSRKIAYLIQNYRVSIIKSVKERMSKWGSFECLFLKNTQTMCACSRLLAVVWQNYTKKNDI